MSSLAGHTHFTKAFSDIPSPPGHWLLGHLGEAKKQPLHRYIYQLAKQAKGLTRLRLLHKQLLIVSQPSTVQELLKARPHEIRRAAKVERVFKEMGLHGVFSAEREDWQRQRQLLNPAFKPSQIKAFFPAIQHCGDTLCANLANKLGKQDIQKTLMAYTVDITSILAFGTDINTLQQEDKEFQTHLNRIFPMLTYRLLKPIPYWKFLRLKVDRQLDQSLAYVQNKVAQLISQARERIAKQRQEDQHYAGANLLEAMILAQVQGQAAFSEKELFANVITLLLAGEDTTANSLAWTLHFLADKPELQEQIYQEIQDHYPNQGKLTFDDLERFPLTFACAQEAMRLVPVAPWLLLEAYQDRIVEGHLIPKGTVMFALLGFTGFLDQCFEQADDFAPERWLNISVQNKKRFASELMHFGYGARLCPGRQLSFVEMKVALIEIIKRFRFRRTPGTHATEKLAFTLMPENLYLDLTPR